MSFFAGASCVRYFTGSVLRALFRFFLVLLCRGIFKPLFGTDCSRALSTLSHGHFSHTPSQALFPRAFSQGFVLCTVPHRLFSCAPSRGLFPCVFAGASSVRMFCRGLICCAFLRGLFRCALLEGLFRNALLHGFFSV